MLVAALYNLGKTEEIKAFIGDKINNEDMFGMVLWFYASIDAGTCFIRKNLIFLII
tara:strand:+ start:70 stop:237 length:168 start_codon:yes stop_codon:yes gene_type:complete